MAAALAAQYQEPTSLGSGALSQNSRTVNVLLTTFAGLGLPRTLSLPVSASTTVHDLLTTIYDRLPEVHHTLIITTTSNKQLLLSNNEAISTLLSSSSDTFLPLRLSARLCGGKGGFGSQLRAAGGRMSSRKKRDQNQNANGSNRTLDGRRVRTVAAAKAAAEYLAKKDSEEKKEQDAKKQSYRDKIDAAENKMDLIKSGKLGVGQGRLDAEYVESKELAEEKTREAVINAMKQSMAELERTGSESSMEVDESGSDEEDEEQGSSASSEEPQPQKKQSGDFVAYGWDEGYDDSDEDDEDIEGDDDSPEAEPTYEGKGKAKV